MRSMASPVKSQEKQWMRPVFALRVQEGSLSSWSPVGQVILTKPSRSGTALSR
jgi:hypothetical protein